MEKEKGGAIVDSEALGGGKYDEVMGDLQVLKTSDSQDLKLARDGKTVLIPQPSDDPEGRSATRICPPHFTDLFPDPLNWSWAKKHMVLLSLLMAALLTDFGMTYGSVVFEAQAATFHMSIPATANSISGGLFLQGPGGLLAVPLVQRFGRLPVLFWSQFLSAIWVMGAAVAPNYAGFTAFRALQGFFNTAPQVVGLTVIHDM